MMSPVLRFACLLFVSVSCLHVLPAKAEEPYEETEKKHSWLSWNKPAEKNPADQLLRANTFRNEGKNKKARKAYKALVVTWPGSAEAPIAQYHLARLLDEAGKLEKAFDEYQVLMDKYQSDFPYEEVLDRQFAIASKLMTTRKGEFLFLPGFEAPERAVPLFEKIVRNGPRWERAAEAQYMVGRANELSMEYESAVVAYMVTQQRYGNTPFAEQAAFGRAVCWYRMADESRNDEEALENAWAALVTFTQAYPQSEQIDLANAYKETILRRRAEMAYNKALYYDRIARKPESALLSYRHFVRLFPNSEWTAIAQARMDALSQANAEMTK